MRFQYSIKKLLRHYLKTFLILTPLYLIALGKTDYTNYQVIITFFKILSAVLLISLTFYLIKEYLAYSQKVLLEITKDELLFDKYCIQKTDIAEVTFFVKNKNGYVGGLYFAYPFPNFQKFYYLLIKLKNETVLEIDLNDIYLENNSTEIFEAVNNWMNK